MFIMYCGLLLKLRRAQSICEFSVNFHFKHLSLGCNKDISSQLNLFYKDIKNIWHNGFNAYEKC